MSPVSPIASLLSDLSDAPDERIAVALADAIYRLPDANDPRFEFCLAEADGVRARLRVHGLEIVGIAT